MYLHIGNYRIISDKVLLGVFNRETVMASDENRWIWEKISDDDKSVIIDRENNIMGSNVSSFTIIKRTKFDLEDCIWRKENE